MQCNKSPTLGEEEEQKQKQKTKKERKKERKRKLLTLAADLKRTLFPRQCELCSYAVGTSHRHIFTVLSVSVVQQLPTTSTHKIRRGILKVYRDSRDNRLTGFSPFLENTWH